MSDIRKKLIAAAVKNLKAFGYPKVDEFNIFTDQIYKAFFRSMLEENLGNGATIDNEINQLLKDVS